MTKSSKLKDLIEETRTLMRKYNVTPKQFRYVCKEVRLVEHYSLDKRKKELPEFFTPPETYALIESARSLSDKHSLLVQILIQTGLRIAELRELDLRDIKDNNTLIVKGGKGGKDRTVPISSKLVELIKLFVKPRTSGKIFVKSNEQPLTKRRLQQMVNESSLKAGLGICHPHKLRHTFACILLNKGFTLENIQLFMGHSSRVTTEIYAKLVFTPEVKDKYLMLFN